MNAANIGTMHKMCFNKKLFTTMVDAYKSILIQQKVYGDHREKRVYKCPVCKKFHITTAEKRKDDLPDSYIVQLLKNSGFDEATANRYLTMNDK